ncbi:NAD(P)-dependent oxidoreductase [Luedemannella helvata]|uniref:NAD(P)H-binding protein n=1 Tax=Luedemannella helvata TaxID=349315 RepID=A0ABN2JX63_9ACTN
MKRIVVFGAGGRAGRRVVAEAASRGHQVTAAGRDTGDVTSADDVARLAAGHDAVVNAAARVDVPAETFFPAAARALVDGLRRAGVSRLVGVGIGTALQTAPGVAVHDAPDFPAPYRAFSLGHVAQLDVLRDADLDWLLLAPPPVVLDDAAPRTGRYRLGDTSVLPGEQAFSYADLAVAIVDQIETPTHHRTMVALGAV